MKLFGTDGIRGDSSEFPFDNKTLFIIGKSAAEILKNSASKILIIRDTRESGRRIQKYLAKGILSAGMRTVFGGVMPTPAASYLVKKGNYCAAIVISASHNPYNDNGIKIFDSKGSKLSDAVEEKIENKIQKYLPLNPIAADMKINVKEDSSLLRDYENFIIKSAGKNSLKGKTIVIDCANGASYKCAPSVLKRLGARVVTLNNKPNGKNINLNCGALHPEYVAKITKERKAFCGFAFDGDADRLICVNENGEIRDGDFFLSSMAKYLKKNKKLKNNVLVTTVMANTGLFKAMKEAGIKVIASKVGDRYVLEDMRKYKSSLGGEQSGHFIFTDILQTGDGLLSAVQLLAALNAENKTFSEFVSGVEKFPQILINQKVAEKIPLEKLPKSLKLIESYKKELAGDGQILVRYSGTENLLRVMLEGREKIRIKEIAEHTADFISGEINDKAGR
ncbi:MAG: phosphoglucosamine mutase [Endomicrobia bacterium]|nr:phosphoglucosamine mutase [Endomicrobiia bacterium]MCL2799768.1 phosphoglucosamine mutase [Endomicrobiia bacterium]